jgi:hypothetical protein
VRVLVPVWHTPVRSRPPAAGPRCWRSRSGAASGHPGVSDGSPWPAAARVDSRACRGLAWPRFRILVIGPARADRSRVRRLQPRWPAPSHSTPGSEQSTPSWTVFAAQTLMAGVGQGVTGRARQPNGSGHAGRVQPAHHGPRPPERAAGGPGPAGGGPGPASCWWPRPSRCPAAASPAMALLAPTAAEAPPLARIAGPAAAVPAAPSLLPPGPRSAPRRGDPGRLA